jgi:hypothetical protein
MGAGLTLGAAVICLVTDRLRRHGVPSTTTFGLASATVHRTASNSAGSAAAARLAAMEHDRQLRQHDRS